MSAPDPALRMPAAFRAGLACRMRWMTLRMLVALAVLAAACIGPHYYYVKKNGEQGVYHRVMPGQTAWRIARGYSVDLETLARVNKLNEALEITTGSYLFIPGVQAAIDVPPYPAPLPSPSAEAAAPSAGATAPLKFIWPAQGTLTSSFGMRNGRKHEGIDIAAPSGTDIRAAADGTVTQSGWGAGDYGKSVTIAHRDGFTTVYSHNSSNLIAEGATVGAGQVIGRMGKTGNATGNHVHFEIRKNGTPLNPLLYLP